MLKKKYTSTITLSTGGREPSAYREKAFKDVGILEEMQNKSDEVLVGTKTKKGEGRR